MGEKVADREIYSRDNQEKETQGYYVLCDFAATPDVVSEIERKFRIDDSVLKYLTVKIADAISAEEIEVARNDAEENAIVPETEEASEETPARERKVEKEVKPEVVKEEKTEEPAEKTETEAAVEEKAADTDQ